MDLQELSKQNNIPFYPIELNTNLQSFDESLKTLANMLRPSWSIDSIKIKKFADGCSNDLFGLFVVNSLSEVTSHADVILVKIFGCGADTVIDRKRDILTLLHMNRHGLSPPLHAVLRNAYAYGFIPGRPADLADLTDPHLSVLIARKVARLHSLPFREHEKEQQSTPAEVKRDAIPLTLNYSNDGNDVSNEQRTPFVFARMRDWLSKIEAAQIKQEKYARSPELQLEFLRNQVELLSRVLLPLVTEKNENATGGGGGATGVGGTAFYSAIANCHNDLLIKNFIVAPDRNDVHVIDFEYSNWNYVAFEIGNHFNEFAGMENMDYARYPDKQFQLTWIRHYLEALNDFSKQKAGAPEVSDAHVHHLYRLANKFSLASHLFWALWGVLESTISTIDYDYLEFASNRMKRYIETKDAFLNL